MPSHNIREYKTSTLSMSLQHSTIVLHQYTYIVYTYKIHAARISMYIFQADSSSAVVYMCSPKQIYSIVLAETHTEHWKQMMNQIGDTKSESLTPFTTSLGELILCVDEPHNILQHGCLCVNMFMCVCIMPTH